MRLGCLLITAVLLSACGDTTTARFETRLLELDTQLELETQTKQGITDLTSFSATLKPYLIPLEARDPFVPINNTVKTLESNSELFNSAQVNSAPSNLKQTASPHLNRPLGSLEVWDLAQLSFSGSMQQGNNLRALIITPDQQLVAVKKGDRMGKNHGTIIHLNQTSITLVELIAYGSDWQERQQTIHIAR